MRRFRPLLAMLLVLGALFSWWLVDRVEESTAPGDAGPSQGPREIDYYVTGLDATRMTAAGVPAHRLRTPQLRHYTDDDTTELEKPRLTVYQDERPPWEVASERAWMSGDGSLLLLHGDVLIERAGDAQNAPLRMTTRDLRVQPREDYAETDEKVRVVSDAHSVDAVGMQAWLRPPSRVKLLSEVKGLYVPETH
ncbi:MAG: LPS export ABC transporter periplasmic protein LptC [Chromatiaceae bacterium]|nr:LPS export ABC transporter periplasmic protein LptC [Gammaproteobacteria bacterium]MCP5305203.1 LPS export ABC transporter periplasmic protein LptC [Chromatiaceae bacterium]MCP5315162.1 LPS export ABC transporter periplasmic protein LptC [Chromatiaceae bacterium]